MNKIKNSYKVETNNTQELESKFYNLISSSIEFNKINDENKNLIAISIRVSYKKALNTKIIYHTLLTKNINIENFNMSELMENILKKLENRNILSEQVTSLHIHFYYL